MAGWRSAAATAVACAPLLLLGACSGGGPAPRPDDRGATAVAVTPHPPSYDGRLAVTLRAGLRVVGEQRCVDPRRVCDARGATYVPLDRGGPASLVAARVRPAAGHTAWTAVLRLDPAGRRALADAARGARSTGGLVLVLGPGRRVHAAVPATQVGAARVVLTGLSKPDAWGLVTGLPRD